MNIELSGGVRDDASLDAALEAGAARVNIGTAALENPDWTASVIKKYGDRVAVGLDVRGHTLAARGWTREGGDLFETMKFLDSVGCSRYVVTDVAKDGMMSGPNIQLLSEVAERTDARSRLPVVSPSWTICAPSRNWLKLVLILPSSASPSMHVRSRSRKRLK